MWLDFACHLSVCANNHGLARLPGEAVPPEHLPVISKSIKMNEGDGMKNRVGRNKLRVLVLAGVCVLALTVVVSAAVAASYQYCSGCTINSNDQRTSAASRNATNSYMHRLSGPSSDTAVTIEVRAFITNGPLVCANANNVRSISCPPYGNYVRGQAVNWGGGNYGFNAHLSW